MVSVQLTGRAGKELCRNCAGSRFVYVPDNYHQERCTRCGGEGYVLILIRQPLIPTTAIMECPNCKAKGVVLVLTR